MSIRSYESPVICGKEARSSLSVQTTKVPRYEAVVVAKMAFVAVVKCLLLFTFFWLLGICEVILYVWK